MNPRLIFPAAFVIFTLALTLNFSACKKDCFDPQMKALHENDACTTDCPGVTGCDGKTYCNECEANRQGIAVVQ